MGHANIATSQKYLVADDSDTQDAILKLAPGRGRRPMQAGAGR